MWSQLPQPLWEQVKFTLGPRNFRPRIVECQETNAFQVKFLENTPLRQEVEVETVLLSVQAGTAYSAPVPEEEDKEELRKSLQDEIDAGALTPAPRERSPLPNYDSSTGITLLIRVPDFSATGRCLR